MKLKTLLVFFALSLAGCSSLTDSTITADKIQNVLTNVLPVDFAGDFAFAHKNPYFDIGVKVIGIHKTPDGKWAWTGLQYDRHDFFNTSGTISLTPKSP